MSKYKKIICIVIVSFFVCFISILTIRMFFQEQVKKFIKSCVCSEVVRKENELIEVVDELKNEENQNSIHRYKNIDNTVSYKDISSKKISNIFTDFHLIFIDNKFNEKGFVGFTIYPYADLLLGNKYEFYSYGFYYSSTDNSRYIATGDTCDLEFERDAGIILFEYRTERIIDNWWYYEMKSYMKVE